MSLPDALILVHDSTHLGGAELHLLKILQACKNLGIRTYLISSNRGSLFEKFKSLTEAQHVHPFPYPRKPKSWLHLFKFLKTCNHFMQRIQAQKPCILVGDFYPLWAALKLSQWGGPVLSLWQGEYRFDSEECIEKWIRYGANHADLLLANDAICKHAHASKHLKRPLAPLNPTIDRERFSPEKYNKKELRKQLGWTHKTAVCVGRYGEGKGQPWLVDQFLSHKNLHKEWQLVLVGPIKEEERSKLEKQLRHKDPENHIKIWGERHDIPEIYAAADVALFPGTVQESYGLAVLEAALMHTPIIAMASGALPFLLGEDFGLIPLNQRNSFMSRWEAGSYSNTNPQNILFQPNEGLEHQLEEALRTVL